MIPVSMPPEPPNFDKRVRRPGREHLRQKSHNPDQPPPNHGDFWKKVDTQGKADYWRRARDDLKESYGNRCVYSCFYLQEEHVYGSVQFKHSIDHFKPVSQHPARLAYEWSNLRWAWDLINTCKKDNIITEAHDPTRMKTNLVKLQKDEYDNWKVVPDPRHGEAAKDDIMKTIDGLGLNNRKIIEARNACIQDFMEMCDVYSDALMEERQPFIYHELKELDLL